MKNVTFRWLIVTIVSIFITSCSPTMYIGTKSGAVKKYCRQDSATAYITVHDTIVINTITADTVFSAIIDSVVVAKDRLVIRYQKIEGKIHLSGEYKGDTIFREKIVKVTIPCNCPPEYKPGWIDTAKTWMAIFGLFALIFGVAVFGPMKK